MLRTRLGRPLDFDHSIFFPYRNTNNPVLKLGDVYFGDTVVGLECFTHHTLGQGTVVYLKYPAGFEPIGG